MGGWMGGWVGGWMDGWVGGWMDGWIDGWVDGWRERKRVYLVLWKRFYSTSRASPFIPKPTAVQKNFFSHST
jgi:hypothetical protein